MNVLPLLRHAKVVGNYFRDDIGKAALKNAVEGDEWFLECDSANEYDALAVRILDKNKVWIGFVPKEYSALFYLPAMKDANVAIVYHGKNEFSVGVILD